jgi:hypothetical protein
MEYAYFDDHTEGAAWAHRLQHVKAVYVVMNPYTKTSTGPGITTADITRRLWFLIDFDPRRQKGSNSTDEELGLARIVAAEVKDNLTSRGWPEPIECNSPNGAHLIYLIDLPNDKASTGLINGILKHLQRFDTTGVEVDQTTADAAQITKLYGTWARKGPATADRPHRLSAITSIPAVLATVPRERLEQLAAVTTKAEKPKSQGKGLYDLDAILAKVEVFSQTDKGDYTEYQIKCPWDAEHSDPGSEHGTIFTWSKDGAPGFTCPHSHCANKRRWEAFRDHLDIKIDDSGIVVRGGDLSSIVDRAETALLTTPIYQRGGLLTRAIKLDTAIGEHNDIRREAGSTVLIAVREPWLVEQMGLTSKWLKMVKVTGKEKTKGSDDGYNPAPIDPPPLYARTLLGRAEWRFPVLRGVVTAPTLARDGRIIETPGFDKASGLLVDIAPGLFAPIPVSPTLDEAIAALAKLAAPLRKFPFVDDAARSVALSALLTALIRVSLRTAPLHAYDAPTAGTGKSLLAEMAGLLATGFKPPALSQGKSDEEDEKRLSTVLFAGDPVIHIDNCERAISGDFLCSMLTQEVVQARILGLSERRVLPSTALVLATGNNLTLAGDTTRRAVICRLDAQVERPDTREFDFDCHAEVLANRPELVVAGLTILRAYHVAGRPAKLTPMGSFNDWEWIRGALVWLGRADPADTRSSILDSDPRKDELISVMEQWSQVFAAEHVTVGHIATRDKRQKPEDAATPADALRARLTEVACKGSWNAKSIGWWLRRNKDSVVGGRCFRCEQGEGRAWWLESQATGGNTQLALNEEPQF